MSTTLTTIRRSPTKDEELAHFRAFLDTVHPSSYLADFFDGAFPAFELAMRSDWVFPRMDTIRALDADHREALDRLHATNREIETARAQLRNLAREEDLIRTRIAALAEEAAHVLARARMAAGK